MQAGKTVEDTERKMVGLRRVRSPDVIPRLTETLPPAKVYIRDRFRMSATSYTKTVLLKVI